MTTEKTILFLQNIMQNGDWITRHVFALLKVFFTSLGCFGPICISKFEHGQHLRLIDRICPIPGPWSGDSESTVAYYWSTSGRNSEIAWRRKAWLQARNQVARCRPMYTLMDQNTQFVLDVLRHTQPVEICKYRSDVVMPLCRLINWVLASN